MKQMTMIALAAISFAAATVTQAAPADASVALASEKRELALALANQDEALRRDLISNLDESQLAVDLIDWLGASAANASLKERAVRIDRDVRVRKGLESEVDSLLQVRLADRSMLEALRNGVEPLYAYEPAGDESSWQSIEAFDAFGGAHYLDVHQMPAQPVLVVDIDAQKDLAAGIRLVRRTLASRSGRTVSSLDVTTATTTPVTILDRIRLNEDHEPWTSGDAEVYAIVVGVDPSRDEPAMDLVQMPYLDTDGRDYFPNQILIFWDRYRWAASDVILMEHDDSTNFQELATRLLDLASEILQRFGELDISKLVDLGNEIIRQLPGSWFSNDDDYVDSYYTLEKGLTYTGRRGAAGNATVSLRPYEIAAQ